MTASNLTNLQCSQNFQTVSSLCDSKWRNSMSYVWVVVCDKVHWHTLLVNVSKLSSILAQVIDTKWFGHKTQCNLGHRTQCFGGTYCPCQSEPSWESKKVKLSLNAMKAYIGRWGTDPLILNCFTRWWWMVSLTTQSHTLHETAPLSTE